MAVSQRKAHTGGEGRQVAQQRALMHINLAVARRELRNAAKRADQLMRAGGVAGAAEAHLRIATAIAELDEIGGSR